MPTEKPKNPAEKFRNQTPRGKIRSVFLSARLASDGGITQYFYTSKN